MKCKWLLVGVAQLVSTSASFLIGRPMLAQVSAISGSVLPASGIGMAQSFTFIFHDPVGVADVEQGHILVTSANGINACHLLYQPGNNVGLPSWGLYLADDAGPFTRPPITPGEMGTISNSQCSVAGSTLSVTLSGTDLTISLTLTFSQSFTGDKSIVLNAYNLANQAAGWATAGTWTVGTQSVATLSDEVATLGPIDGTNRIFVLPHWPAKNTCPEVYRNGLRLQPGDDYFLSGKTITLADKTLTPQPGDKLFAAYRY